MNNPQQELSVNTQKIQNFLATHGVSTNIVTFAESTRTAQEAADAIGCSVAQIAKSIIFKTKNTGCPVLVIASGIHRVDEKKVAALVGEPLIKADADFVKSITGFVIGGIPPFGHLQKIPTFIDESLLQFAQVWAAAGTPHTVFRIRPQELLTLSNGTLVSI